MTLSRYLGCAGPTPAGRSVLGFINPGNGNLNNPP
jgi:hypothetical protein